MVALALSHPISLTVLLALSFVAERESEDHTLDFPTQNAQGYCADPAERFLARGVSHRHKFVMFAANNDCVSAGENDSILR
jgi:hypothetical protein